MRSNRTAAAPAKRAWLLSLLLIVLVQGCDTLEEPGTLQQTYQKTFRFQFNGSQLQVGRALEIESANTVDLTSDLQGDGFTTAEVVSARVTAAEIDHVQPLDVGLQALTSAAFLFRAGSSTTEVGSRTGFASGSVQALTVQSADVSSFVRRPQFKGVLRLTPAQVSAGAYVVEVTVSFRVDLEGV